MRLIKKRGLLFISTILLFSFFIIGNNNKHRVFYNDVEGESLILFNMINNTMLSWMNSNLN